MELAGMMARRYQMKDGVLHELQGSN
jgi:hypothetical protein